MFLVGLSCLSASPLQIDVSKDMKLGTDYAEITTGNLRTLEFYHSGSFRVVSATDDATIKVGGGGGGGGGAGGGIDVKYWGGGGGGGGGSAFLPTTVAVSANKTYDVRIGKGGGGTYAGKDGNNGDATELTFEGVPLVSLPGGHGGRASVDLYGSKGGLPADGSIGGEGGDGGDSAPDEDGSDGDDSSQNLGGKGGAAGALPGGAGGGGGAGFGGAGANALTGDSDNAADNSCAGGAGGHGSGMQTQHRGGNGGSGIMVIIYQYK
jgi:hypothetical protein